MAHVILVSALGPNPSFFLFWGTFIQLGGLLGQGLGLGLGPGLDNKFLFLFEAFKIVKIEFEEDFHVKGCFASFNCIW